MFKLTVNPLLRPPGEGLIFSNPIWGGGGLIETGSLFERGFIYLEMTMVSVPHKERARIQSGKAQVQEGWKSYSRGSESNSNFQLVNKPFRISPHEVHIRDWLIQSIIY